jgi:hypothetical protein
LIGTVRADVDDVVFRCGQPTVRSGNEARRAIVGSKFIDHQNEAGERPIDGVTRNIDVQLLGNAVRAEAPGQQRTKLERPAEDATACFQQRRKDVQPVEFDASIHKVIDPRRC